MKTCPACNFDNPDMFVRCLQCNRELPLTIQQAQELQQRAAKLTDNIISKDEESLLNSWATAMAHRFDWLWHIGDQIEKLKFHTTSLVIILIILIALIGLSYMLSTALP